MRRLLTWPKALQPRINIDILDIIKKEGKKLTDLENFVDAAISRHENYAKKSKTFNYTAQYCNKQKFLKDK